VVTHLLAHSDWPLIALFGIVRQNRGIDFPDMPDDIAALAFVITMPCVACGREIHPIRERDREGYDRRWANLGPYYYSGTCPTKIRPACSRTSAASEDIDRVIAALQGHAFSLPTPRLF
jgi:hypothetical protein